MNILIFFLMFHGGTSSQPQPTEDLRAIINKDIIEAFGDSAYIIPMSGDSLKF